VILAAHLLWKLPSALQAGCEAGLLAIWHVPQYLFVRAEVRSSLSVVGVRHRLGAPQEWEGEGEYVRAKNAIGWGERPIRAMRHFSNTRLRAFDVQDAPLRRGIHNICFLEGLAQPNTAFA